jgi:hypothetical protein
MTRCAEVLSSLYAPVPEDADDEDAWDSTTHFFNSTRSVERGNRHVREFFFNIENLLGRDVCGLKNIYLDFPEYEGSSFLYSLGN